VSAITIYMPNRGQIETETVESLLLLQAAVASSPMLDLKIGVHFHTGDSLIPRGRNECAAHFIRSAKDAMLFIDSDIVFSSSDVVRLWATGLDLVGANYHVTRRSVRTDEERMVVPIAEGAPELAPVSRLATGFMLIRRVVFERMLAGTTKYLYPNGDPRWDFFGPFVRGDEYLSEDYAFVTRAIESGTTPYMHTGIKLGHIGRKEW